MNQCVFLGRICNEPKLVKLEDGKVVCNITLAVDRSFKNSVTDNYDTDFIRISVWEGIAYALYENCPKGSTICTRCRVQNKKRVIQDTTIDTYDFIGEMVNFVNIAKRKDNPN